MQVFCQQRTDKRVQRSAVCLACGVGSVGTLCGSGAAELLIAEMKTDNQKFIHRKLVL
jgi:hypothetical protein